MDNLSKSPVCGQKQVGFNLLGALGFRSTCMRLLALFCVLSFASCKDANDITGVESLVDAELHHGVGGSSSLWYANKDNPYDYYGELHNAGLDYYMANRTYSGGDTSEVLEDMRDRIEEFVASEPQLEGESLDGVVMNRSFLPPTHKNAVVAVGIERVYRAVVSNANKIGHNDISDCIDEIKYIESQMDTLVEEDSVSLYDASEFYKVSSVARYSLAYWNDVDMDGKSPWRDIDGDEDSDPVPGFWGDLWDDVTDFFSDATNIAGVACCALLDAGGVAGGVSGAIWASGAGAYWWEIGVGWD